jgi:predicted phage terminase large subunit-like protein
VVDAIDGRSSKVIVIDAPPRHGKSEFVSRWLPAWYLLSHPDRRVILASYGADFARSWGRKVREIVKEWHRFTDPRARVSPHTSAATDWETVAGGGMITAGVGGPLTGRGAHLLLLDDYLKNDVEALSATTRDRHWDWWQTTASTRLEPGGVAIVMATRWHQDDLSGRILRQAEEGESAPVTHLHLPAIAEENDVLGREPGEALWPERWPIESLEDRRRKTDPFWWSALYQGRPTRSGRMEWPDDYFGASLWGDPMPDRFDCRVIAVDPSKGKDAKRGDYSAIVFLGLAGGKLWVDAMLGRWPVRQMCEVLVGMHGRYGADGVSLESNQFQDLIAPELDRVCGEKGIPPLPIMLVNNAISKEVRIGRLGGYLSRDVLRIRPTQSTRLLVEQLREFPHGQHDDGPDALEMAIRLMQHVAGRGQSHDDEDEVLIA